MRKVRDLRAMMKALSTAHARLGSGDTAKWLTDLSNALDKFDDQTVNALVKRLSTLPSHH